jgi:hypothetical protein
MNYLDFKRRWVNRFPQNKIQTRYLRGMKQPSGELTSSFTDAVERFEMAMEEYKTVYDKYMKPLEEVYHD